MQNGSSRNVGTKKNLGDGLNMANSSVRSKKIVESSKGGFLSDQIMVLVRFLNFGSKSFQPVNFYQFANFEFYGLLSELAQKNAIICSEKSPLYTLGLNLLLFTFFQKRKENLA